MKNIDWKDSLGSLYAGDEEFEKLQNEAVQDNLEPALGKQHLRIELDKKGRNGKQATLISGFEGTEDQLKEFARKIKTTCGVGGSTREGEILIQGDFREKVSKMLTEQGHKIKRINF